MKQRVLEDLGSLISVIQVQCGIVELVVYR